MEPVDIILSDCEVYVPRIVIAERLQGAHGEKDVSVILGFFGAFTVVGEREDTRVKRGLSYALKKKGRTANLADCYIAPPRQKKMNNRVCYFPGVFSFL